MRAAIYDRNWQEIRSWALRGIPSRTRLDGAGSTVATTVFVTGHSYAGTGFSTETVINPVDGGPGTGSLEAFALWVNGAQLSPTDRNIWGVTFLPGQSDSFYATAASNGRMWLVEGSVSSRKLTAVHDGVECPSVSPDGKRIAFKKNMAGTVNRTGTSRSSIFPRGRSRSLRRQGTLTTRLNGWTTTPCCMDWAGMMLPETATFGDPRTSRIPGRDSSSNTPGRRQ